MARRSSLPVWSPIGNGRLRRADDVSQLGRRDRARERHLLARMLDPLSQGGALGGGATRTWAARTGEGADPEAPSSSNVVAEYLEEIDLAMAVGPSRTSTEAPVAPGGPGLRRQASQTLVLIFSDKFCRPRVRGCSARRWSA